MGVLAIHLGVNKHGSLYARQLKRRHCGYGDTFFIDDAGIDEAGMDEVGIKIGGKQYYLWRAIDLSGEVVEVLLQACRDGKAAKRFFKRLKRCRTRKIVRDNLRSYNATQCELLPDVIHEPSQHANNRAGRLHQPTRVSERGMRKFISMRQVNRLRSVHTAVYNLFNLGRNLIAACYYRKFRPPVFASWNQAVAA